MPESEWGAGTKITKDRLHLDVVASGGRQVDQAARVSAIESCVV